MTDDLRKLAEAATPGPWQKIDDTGIWAVCSDMHRVGIDFNESDAAFIAAANPAKIIELLDAIEAQRKLLEQSYDTIKIIRDKHWVHWQQADTSRCAAMLLLLKDHLRQQEGEK